MESIIIKAITLQELEALQQISKQTFLETFAAANTAENMSRYLAQQFSLEALTEQLENPDSAFHVAMLDNQIIGYVKLNAGASQTEIKDQNGLEIERIYVLKDFHGKKVGQLLYDRVLAIAKQKQVDYVWLGVWEENPRAIGFYKKNGFVEFDKHTFKLGDDEQTDIMMKLHLK
jgi:ribosomal protein S18 acetylase RimI-like enzyme